MWNGEQITVGGQTFGGNGESGPDAAYALWNGRGGSKGWEEKQDQTKWGTATKAEKEQQNTQNNIASGVTGGFNTMYSPAQYSQASADQNRQAALREGFGRLGGMQ